MAIGVQTDMATPALARFGSDYVRKTFLEPSIKGDLVRAEESRECRRSGVFSAELARLYCCATVVLIALQMTDAQCPGTALGMHRVSRNGLSFKLCWPET
jgi:hypothetical protein